MWPLDDEVGECVDDDDDDDVGRLPVSCAGLVLTAGDRRDGADSQEDGAEMLMEKEGCRLDSVVFIL